MLFKNISLTLLAIKLSKLLGMVIFQYPSNYFKFSSLGIFFIFLKIIFNSIEVIFSMEVDSSFYFGPSGVLNAISLMNLIIYAVHHYLVSLLNILLCKKMFKLFRKIEAIEREVIMKNIQIFIFNEKNIFSLIMLLDLK